MRTVTKSAASASSDADVQSPDTAEPVLLHHNSTSLSSLSLKSDNGTSPNVAETEAAAVAFQKRDSRNADVRELIGYASSSFSSLSLDAAEASPTTAVLSKEFLSSSIPSQCATAVNSAFTGRRAAPPCVPPLPLSKMRSPRDIQFHDVQYIGAANTRRFCSPTLRSFRATSAYDPMLQSLSWVTTRRAAGAGGSRLTGVVADSAILEDQESEDQENEASAAFWIARHSELRDVFEAPCGEMEAGGAAFLRLWLRHAWGELVFEQEKNEHIYALTRELECEKEQLQQSLLVTRVQLETAETQVQRLTQKLSDVGSQKQEQLLVDKVTSLLCQETEEVKSQAAAEATLQNHVFTLKTENASQKNRIAELEKELSYFQSQLAFTKVRMATILEDHEKVKRLNRYHARCLRRIDSSLVIENAADERRLDAAEHLSVSAVAKEKGTTPSHHAPGTRKYTGFFQRVQDKAFKGLAHRSTTVAASVVNSARAVLPSSPRSDPHQEQKWEKDPVPISLAKARHAPAPPQSSAEPADHKNEQHPEIRVQTPGGNVDQLGFMAQQRTYEESPPPLTGNGVVEGEESRRTSICSTESKECSPTESQKMISAVSPGLKQRKAGDERKCRLGEKKQASGWKAALGLNTTTAPAAVSKRGGPV